MPRVPIDDLDDPRIAVYRNLKTTNATRASGLFVVEGEKLVGRLAASRYPVDSVLATDRVADRIAAGMALELPCYVVPQALVSVLVGFNFHQGVLAAGRRLPPVDPLELARSAGLRLLMLACPRIDNPENLGSILRSADVFGVDAVLVGGRCPDPLSRRVLRVSMGTALHLPTIPTDDLAGVVDRLRSQAGADVIATILDPKAEPLGTFRRPDRLIVLLGCEGTGLDADWEARADRRLTIPMRPGAESLNVGVAAGILLYHLARPRADVSTPRRSGGASV